MGKATTKTVNQIDREAVFLAEYIMTDLMTACLSMDTGFIAAVDIQDDGGWYLGDSCIEGESNVKLSTTLEFQDAQEFSSTAMDVYEGILHTATQKQTTVVPATSFTHSASLEQVVVRIPQNVAGVVSGILVQNDSLDDEFGNQGIRINSLGDYGLEVEMWRWLNGDIMNGIEAVNASVATYKQIQQTSLDGTLLIPTYGLTGGDIILQVDSSQVTTRTYTPIITSSVGSSQMDTVRQTQSAPSNTAQTIVRQTEN